MFLAIYGTGSLAVFSIGLNAFLKDDSTPNTHITSWVVLGLATVLWPLVLPSMLRAKSVSRDRNMPLQPEYFN
jgi:hypothetical protein